MSTAPRMAHWKIRLPSGVEFPSDQLTLDECERAETISGTPYTLLNPAARVKDAKALFLVAMLRAGNDELTAVQTLKTLTLADAIDAFTYVPAEGVSEDSEELPPS